MARSHHPLITPVSHSTAALWHPRGALAIALRSYSSTVVCTHKQTLLAACVALRAGISSESDFSIRIRYFINILSSITVTSHQTQMAARTAPAHVRTITVRGGWLSVLLVATCAGGAHAGCAYPPDVNGHVVVPPGATTVAANAFYDCASLKSVTLPSTLTSIGDYTFYGAGPGC